MNKGFFPGVVFSACSLLFAACGNSNSNKKADGDPIILGDASTIVTEHDSTYLKDMVVDLKPGEVVKDTTAAQPVPADTAKTAAAKPAAPATAPATNVNGLSIPFKEVTVFIPGVTAKAAGNQDLQKTNGATYRLTGGKINGTTVQISNATITNVSLRYQSAVAIKNNLGTLELDALGTTSGWKTIKGNNGSYNISGLDPNQLAIARVNAGTLRSAISKKARQRRMNRKTEQQWQNSVRNVRSANQKPLEVSLRAVMLKIDGKDKAGKSFSKQVRIDL